MDLERKFRVLYLWTLDAWQQYPDDPEIKGLLLSLRTWDYYRNSRVMGRVPSARLLTLRNSIMDTVAKLLLRYPDLTAPDLMEAAGV